jgi:hypothetical protein
VPLNGWVFTIQTPLKEVTLTPTDQDLPEIKAEKVEAMKTLGKTYPGFVPGDYRVQRIFCALASELFQTPLLFVTASSLTQTCRCSLV